jgi:hypothetical protein
MKTRVYVATLAALPVNAVLFGAGAITVLSVPALSEHATILMPNAVLVSLALTPPIAWVVSRRMMLRYWRRPAFRPAILARRS